MKKRLTKEAVVLLALVLGISLTAAQAAQQKAAKTGGKTHPVTAEVVSVDTTAKTVTLRAEGKTSTAAVEGDALKALSTLKVGDRVTAMCRDNEKGEHQALVRIRLAAAKPSPKK